jgi:hypothetical protein
MISNGRPRKTDQITRTYTFLVTLNDSKVTCYSMFKILLVVSSGCWQQDIYHSSAEIDTVKST